MSNRSALQLPRASCGGEFTPGGRRRRCGRLARSRALALLALAFWAAAAGAVDLPALADVRFAILDGKTQQEHGADDCPGLAVACREGTAEGRPFVEVAVSNRREEEAWLEVRCAGRLTAAGEWLFYDALAPKQPAADLYEAETTFFPAIALAGADAGVWVGVDPRQIFSLLAYSFDGRDGETRGAFRFGARVVVDPGRTETVRFAFVPFKPDYGHRSALEAYYEAFPELFTPAAGIDPRLIEGGCALDMLWRMGGPCKGDYSAPEIARRSHATWDWMYGPFRIPGDYLMRKERWDLLKPTRRGTTAQTWRQIELFRAARQDYFERTDVLLGAAPAFYTCPWTHEDLARTIYADSLMTEDLGWENGKESKPGWIAKRRYVKVGPWCSVEVLGWGTSAGEAFRRDFEELVEGELSFSAFAMDSNVCGGRYRGPRLAELPHRGWDDKGAFVSEGVAQALAADFMHGLKKNGFRIGVVSNHAPTHYAVAFRLDAAILELTPGSIVLPGGRIIDREYTRAQMGRKPRDLYSTFYHIAFCIRHFEGWETMTPDQIRQTMCALHDRVLIWALAYGWNLTPDLVMGDRRLARYAGVLAELNRLGWRAVPAMKPDAAGAGLYLSRYGGPERCALVLGANDEAPVATSVTLDCARLGAQGVLAADWWGAPQRVRGNAVRLFIRPRDVVVLKPLVLADAPLDGQVRETRDVHAGKIVAEFGVAPPGRQVALRVVIPADARAGQVTLNGRPVEFGSVDGGVRLAPQRLEGENELVVEYVSTEVHCEADELLGFPFIDSNVDVALAQIVTPASAQEHEAAAAFRLGEYFRFWTASQRGREVSVPIVKQGEEEDVPRVFVGAVDGAKPPGVSREGKDLYIRGATPRATYRLTVRVLYALDARYPIVGKYQNQTAYPERPLIAGHIDPVWRKRRPWIAEDVKGQIKEIFSKGGFWARPLRRHTGPAPPAARTDEPEADSARAQQPGQSAGRAYLFAPSAVAADPALANDGGTLEVKPDCLHVAAQPKSRFASLLLPVVWQNVTGERKTLRLRLRVAAPESVGAVRFVITARSGGEWAPLLCPTRVKRTLAAGEWRELSFDLTKWETIPTGPLRLYHSYQEPLPVSFDVAAVWVE